MSVPLNSRFIEHKSILLQSTDSITTLHFLKVRPTNLSQNLGSLTIPSENELSCKAYSE